MLKQKLKTSFLSKIFVQLFQVIGTIMVARLAGPTVLGTTAFGLAFVNMFSFIGSFGLGSAHIKIISEEEDKPSCTCTYAILHIFTKTVFLIFLISYFIIQKYVVDFPFESRDHEIVIWIFIGLVFVNTFTEIPRANFLAGMQQAKQDIPEIIRNFILQPARIIAVLLGGAAVALAFVNFISAVLIVPIYWYLSKNIKYGKFNFILAKRYFHYGIPLVVLAVASSFNGTLDKVMLQYFTNSEEVGYYTVGFRLGGFFLTIGQSAALLFFPYFAKAISEKKEYLIKEKILQYERFIFIFVMPVMIFLSIFSQTLIIVTLGEKYISSIPILTIIIIGQFIYMLNIPYGNLLSGMGHFRLNAILNIVFIGVLAFLMFIFVHPMFLNLSGKGASFAFSISKALLAASYVYFASKEMNVFNLKLYFRFLIFGIFIFFLFFILYNKWVLDNYWLTIAFPVVYFLFVYLCYFYLGWINMKDWEFLLSAIRIKPMLTYIKNELFNR